MTNGPYSTETFVPAEQASVAEAVRAAIAQGKAIYPMGGGTRFSYGVAPSRPGIGLSLTNLNRVLDYPADDMTITVEAGITVAELSRCLAAKRQRLPVDVAMADRATVGGAIAVNASGPCRYAYGTMRDYVLGFTAVDGTGETFSGGGRVVKNAAGYNMNRLVTGSLGTLGIVTKATLMVRPMPEMSAAVTCDVGSFDAAEKVLSDLVRTATRPVAIELLTGRQCDDDSPLGPIAAGNVGRVCVGFEGPADEVEWMVGQLRDEWAKSGVAASVNTVTTGIDQLWQWFADFPADVEIHVLPSATVATIERLLKVSPQSAVRAHAGNGVIHVGAGDWGRGAGDENTACSPTDIAGRIQQLRAIAVAAGGTMVVAQRPEGVELTADAIWGPPGPMTDMMQAIKDRFDPHNLLNPGRFRFA